MTSTVDYIVAYPHPDVHPSDSVQRISMCLRATVKDLHDRLVLLFPEHATQLKKATFRKALNLATSNVNTTSRGPVRKWIHDREGEEMPMYLLLKECFPDSPDVPTSYSIQIVAVTNEILEDADYLDDTNGNALRMHTRSKEAEQLGTSLAPSDSIKDPHNVKATVYNPGGPRYGRPSFRFGPPTVLFNNSLAVLKYDLEHLEKLTPTFVYVNAAFKLVTAATGFFDNEAERGKEIEQILPAFFGQNVKWGTPIADGKAKPDGVLFEGPYACLIFELKNEPGLGGDPFLQSLVVYEKVIKHQYSGFTSRSNFPVVLLSMAGNCLVVSTAIYTDAVYADKLLTIDLHLGLCGPANVLRVARVFTAISECTDELSRYYRRLQPEAHPSVMYPSPTADPPENQSQIPRLEFFAKVDHASGTQLAIFDEANKRHAIYLANRACSSTGSTSTEVVLVKFTASYDEEAHLLLAKHVPPLAPKLYSCHRVIGGLKMVVMEYLSNASPLHRFFPPNPVPYSLKDEVVRHSLKKALELLHSKNLVFGDLRVANVLYSHEGDRVFLVDFDWVGKHQESRYSPCLNPEAKLGVDKWQVMEKAHDEANLKAILKWL
ncbi:hypothetical protein BJ322DRAFT_1212559 [Thelephora terrestris]|uniref:Protein kinase domain-containing protein n=1 Tax=Thelephora terrestris TaxID=56493 RepID=A0A9P6L490_9AGAM|nr:hypothetical protein BJ322DRAFT_1212559 [Thelephora terrestris]